MEEHTSQTLKCSTKANSILQTYSEVPWSMMLILARLDATVMLPSTWLVCQQRTLMVHSDKELGIGVTECTIVMRMKLEVLSVLSLISWRQISMLIKQLVTIAMLQWMDTTQIAIDTAPVMLTSLPTSQIPTHMDLDPNTPLILCGNSTSRLTLSKMLKVYFQNTKSH